MGGYLSNIPVKFCPKSAPTEHLHQQPGWAHSKYSLKRCDGISLKMAPSSLEEFKAFLTLEGGWSQLEQSNIAVYFFALLKKVTEAIHSGCVAG